MFVFQVLLPDQVRQPQTERCGHLIKLFHSTLLLLWRVREAEMKLLLPDCQVPVKFAVKSTIISSQSPNSPSSS